ncbi:MAG: FtsX-like permease family protein [Anaerolineaceae bacterium]|nr:FtsX-like permease family protein [Anaerolineaceae bacterium]
MKNPQYVPNLLRRFVHFRFLAFGLLIISLAFQFVSAAIYTTNLTADRDLSGHWRTSYDILVRPPESRNDIEEHHGLVEANSLSGIAGGITYSQFELIKALPGIEVAAPIAMLGYIPERLQAANFGVQAKPGIYESSVTLEINNGVNSYSTVYGGMNFYVGADAKGGFSSVPKLGMTAVNPPYSITSNVDLSFLMAGIDPFQESQLVGLDRALLTNEVLEASLTDPSYEKALHQALIQGLIQSVYLDDNKTVSIQKITDREGKPETLVNVPVLINATPYVQLKLRTELKRKVLPPEVTTLAEIITRGGGTYLASLPEELVATKEMDSAQAYKQLAINLLLPNGLASRNPFPFPETATMQTFSASIPSPIKYQEAQLPFPGGGNHLEILLPQGSEAIGYKAEPAYRESTDGSTAGKQNRFNANFILDAIGVFDIERLPKPTDANRVPLETYFPPLAILRYDMEGHPVEPRMLNPTLNLAGYIQSPPLILTTLKAARLIAGEDCISAIRIRIKGLDRLDHTAQQKIEAIASEIHRLTGLDVDIMVGSSPKRILVKVPDIGIVEEQWVQKGVNTQIGQSINQTNLFLLGVFSGVCVIFVFSTTLVSVIQRKSEIGLLKALGWRSHTVFNTFIAEILGVVFFSTLLGIGLSVGLSWLFHLDFLWSWAGEAFVLTLVVGGVGGLLPVWSSIHSTPAVTLQMGQISPIRQLWFSSNYPLQSLYRRPVRNLVVMLGQAAGSGMVVLILLAIFQSHGYLVGTLTLLGEYIQQRVGCFHYLIATLCLLLSGLSLSDQMILAVREQSREIGLLMAVGWRTRGIFTVFITQGLALGLVGGIIGSLSAVMFYGLLSTSLPWSALWFGLLGICLSAATGGIAAWIPALKATQMHPVETLRGWE